MYPLIATVLLASSYPVWESKEIYSSWTSKGQGYEYIYELYTDRELTQRYLTQPPTQNTYTYVTVYDTNLYFQRVKYYHPGNPQDFEYYYLGQFYINLYFGYYTEDIPYLPPQEPEPTPQPQPQPPKPTPMPPPSPPMVEDIPKKESFLLPDDMDNRKYIEEDIASVLGIHESTNKDICNIVVTRESTTKYSVSCSVNIQVNKVEYLNHGNYFTLQTEGTYPEYINVNIQVYECKKFTLLDPQTWFGCKKILVDSYQGSTKALYSGFLVVNGIKNNTTSFSFKSSSFWMKNIFLEDIYSKNVILNLDMYLQVKLKEWVDVKYPLRVDLNIPKAETVKPTKPFTYPLTKLIGVTQWHGCTYYQCPHKGIDFGATVQKVVSIGDGTVVNAGFDKYGGECNQGGKFVIVKHSNGMHSAYIHLDSYSVKIGDKVKKGSQIAISGNTGKKNCQNFAYHLHFETRKKVSSSTHVNPVPYIDVNWDMVPTLGFKQFPGRLTGDNPHPNF